MYMLLCVCVCDVKQLHSMSYSVLFVQGFWAGFTAVYVTGTLSSGLPWLSLALGVGLNPASGNAVLSCGVIAEAVSVWRETG